MIKQRLKATFCVDKKKGIYEPAEPLVKAQLEKFQPGIITDTVNNVIHKLARRHQHMREEFDADKNIWNMQNGLYDIAANKLKPHTYRYLSRNQIPIRFDPKARCKRFGKFLGEVVYPDQIRTVVEVLAYTFLRYKANPEKVIAWLDAQIAEMEKSVLNEHEEEVR